MKIEVIIEVLSLDIPHTDTLFNPAELGDLIDDDGVIIIELDEL